MDLFSNLIFRYPPTHPAFFICALVSSCWYPPLSLACRECCMTLDACVVACRGSQHGRRPRAPSAAGRIAAASTCALCSRERERSLMLCAERKHQRSLLRCQRSRQRGRRQLRLGDARRGARRDARERRVEGRLELERLAARLGLRRDICRQDSTEKSERAEARARGTGHGVRAQAQLLRAACAASHRTRSRFRGRCPEFLWHEPQQPPLLCRTAR